MNRVLRRILLATVMFMLFLTSRVNANVTSNDPTTTSGGQVSITLKSSEKVYAYKINLVNSGGLVFKGVTSTAGQTNGTTANGASSSGVTTLATYTFQAPQVTNTTTYAVQFSLSVSTDGENYTSVSNKSTVTVNAPKTTETPTTTQPPATTAKSSDATLKSITIGSKTYSGSSLKNTITYTADAKVNSIKISAVKNNSKATVSGTGTKSLVAGQTNKFTINVTAEDGTKKAYNINIIRLIEESTVPNVIEGDIPETENAKLTLSSLIIKDVELDPEFNSETYTYVANVQNMTQLEIDATANNPDAEINIEGATDLKQGDNIVKITVTLGEEKVEYIIDVYNTIQNEIVGTIEDENNSNDENKISTNPREIMLIMLICVLALIAIRYIIISYKLSKEFEDLDDDIIIDDEEDETFEVKNQNISTKTTKVGRHF